MRCLTSGNDRPDVIVTTREAELPLDPALQTVNSFGIGWTYMPQSMRLQGKKALVTGSDTGIGHEIGLEFARQGADVIFHYVQESDGALAAVEQAKALGRKSAAFQADFDNLDQVFALAKQSIEFLGGINCLVNNAGVTMNRPFLKVTPDQFDKMFHINFRGQYFLTQKIVERHVATERRRNLQYVVRPRTARRTGAFGLRGYQRRNHFLYAFPRSRAGL